jgi:SNF2 family DNA or RNA helicase
VVPKRAKTAAVKAMKHQQISLAHDAKSDIVLDLSDGGTGKTFVRAVAFAERRRKKVNKWGCLLVLAPRTLLRTAWENDFKKFAPDMKVSVANADNREKAFNEDADVYIPNHDAVNWLVKQSPAFWLKFSEIVIDEPTAFKHATSKRSHAMAQIVHKKAVVNKKPLFKRRAGLTATPTSNGICDIWHQMYILDGGKRLGNSYFAFRGAVCTPVRVGRSEHAIEWRDKPGAEEAVFGLLSDITIRHKIDDCTDIPQTHTYDVPYELPPKVRRAYDDLELTQLLMLTGGTPKGVKGKLAMAGAKMRGSVLPATPTKITAINAAAVATKLLQLCSGAVYDNERKYHLLDTGRYEMTLDLVEARAHSLVFFQWHHQRDHLKALADARKIKYAIVDGSVSDDDRARIVKEYQQGAYQTVFAHPKTAAHGLTLTRGTATIWPSPIYDLELWKQGNMRQRRIGQKFKTEVIVIVAPGTIEERVYDLLMGKNTRMTNLLTLFEQMAKEVVL